ncbi:serine hydrolase domain-containing protein [Croceicoccus marinus]|uniref:Beta-lactamase family protein n=1 Tax=Croceicoccus marinus TaxID=450378 RepID=A0A7G6W0J3_9SPHN|nr:serine hydrolase domain-containing protein [Croceicoccus marinus]QNE07508.1 beta-lactamase family protein [Croceicoccus marinus]
MTRSIILSLLAATTLAGPAIAQPAPAQPVIAQPTIAQSGAAVQEAPHQLSPEKLERITALLQDYARQGRIAGAVVKIRQDGRDVYSQAVGWRDREARAPMREDTIFRIASQSKALTSVAVMMLMEEGRLLLNDPVGKFLPEWQQTSVAVPRDGGGYDIVPADRAITIRDLLTHTAGISYGYGPAADAWREAGITDWYFADRDEPVSAVVARMAALPMDRQPGEAFVYGYNTDILGVVVEKISGQTLDAFLRERLIDPLGMTDTSFYLPDDKADRLAVVYADEDEGISRAPDAGDASGRPYGQGHYLNGPRAAFSGGAGLLSTAADYSRFLEMMRRGGELDGKRYLGPKTVELMTVNHLADAVDYTPGMGFGLGFAIREDLGLAGEPGSEGEFAWGGAYHSTYWVDPKERMTVSYMVQLIPSGDNDLQGKLRTLIYQAME